MGARASGGPATASAWLDHAKAAGLEITLDELRSETERLVGKPIATPHLLASLRSLFDGQLEDASLDAVASGAGPAAATPKVLKVTTQNVVPQPGAAQAEFVGERGPISVGFDPGKNNSR